MRLVTAEYLLAGVLCLGTLAAVSSLPGTVPQDVLLFEQVKDRIPPMLDAGGRPYGGLSMAKILTRAQGNTPFFVGYDELAEEDEPPLPADVIVAFGCYCEVGIRDAGPGGPHFSRSINALVRVERYTAYTPGTPAPIDRSWAIRVVYCRHYWKAFAQTTPAGIAAAVAFFSHPLPAVLGIRPAGGETVPILAEDQRGALPLRKGQ
jgi:hypothetical protein